MRLSPAEARDYAFVTAACLAGGLLVPQFAVLGVPLCAFGLAWLAYRFGIASSIGAAVFTTAVVAAALAVRVPGSPLPPQSFAVTVLSIAPALLAAGPMAAVMLRTRAGLRVTAIIAGASFAGTIAAAALDAALSGTDLVGVTQRLVQTMTDAVKTTQGQAGGAVLQQQLDLVRAIAMAWPALELLGAIAAGAVSVAAVSWVAKRLGVHVKRLPPLERLDLDWNLSWVAVAGFGLLAWASYARQPDGVVAFLGWNVMVIARGLLFVQGLAVFAGLYRKARLGPLGRVLGYAFLVLAEIVIPPPVPIGLVSVTGLADLWINIRRLPRKGSEGPAGSLEQR